MNPHVVLLAVAVLMAPAAAITTVISPHPLTACVVVGVLLLFALTADIQLAALHAP